VLCLKRLVGERIRLLLPDGRVCWIQVVDAWGGRVRLALHAPQEVRIDREERLAAGDRFQEKQTP
jgi:sRNA-binding carbon storage regulator CsrA